MAAVLVVLLALGASRVGAADGESGHKPPTATAPAAAHARCAAARAGDHDLDVDAGTGPRRILVHVPAGGTPAARPLVLGLGGAGQTARDFQRMTNYSGLADRERFVVVYAAGSGAAPFWNTSGALPGKPDDVAFLDAVLDRVERLACVDASRVYATGVSNGGGMTALLGCRLAWRLTAIAPVAGGYGTQPPCHPARPLALLEVHGAADEVVPYVGKGAAHVGAVPGYLSMWRRINGCEGAARMLGSLPTDVTEETWGGCARGADVVHDVIAHEPHSWPAWTRTRAYSTTWRTWTFFRGHVRAPLPAPVTATG
ncbi:MAG TPA: PHB depolymerase family esterase [Solirubrobacteraceae bacterium]